MGPFNIIHIVLFHYNNGLHYFLQLHKQEELTTSKWQQYLKIMTKYSDLIVDKNRYYCRKHKFHWSIHKKDSLYALYLITYCVESPNNYGNKSSNITLRRTCKPSNFTNEMNSNELGLLIRFIKSNTQMTKITVLVLLRRFVIRFFLF